MAKIIKIRQFISPVLMILAVGLILYGKSTDLRVDQVFVNNRINPVGVEGQPEFRWTVVSRKNGSVAARHEIKIWGFKTGRREDNKTIRREDVKTLRLEEGKRYEWQVRVKDGKGRFSAWSKTAWFVTGIPDTDWAGANWIGFEELPDSLRLVPGVHGSGNNLGNLAVKRPVIPTFQKTINIT